MDSPLWRSVPATYQLSVVLALRLHLQHDGERGCGHSAEPTLDRLLHCEIQEDRQVMGGMAGSDCGMDRLGNELGAVRFRSLGPHARRSCALASGHRHSNNLVVQVSTSRVWRASYDDMTDSTLSFLIKDAQEDLQSQRLKA